MDVAQIKKHLKVANAAPYYEWLESDQTLPAGMWRIIASGDQLLVQRATAVDWSTYDTPLTIAQGGIAATWTILDDILLKLGTDGDIAMLNRATTLDADTALASVLIGTPESQAIAANSLMISNITASGDIALYVNKGGASQMVLWADGSTGDTAIMAASGQSVDIYIAGSKVIDISATTGVTLNTTLTPDATRTYMSLSLGTRVAAGEKTVTMVAAADQNLDPVQFNLNIAGANPTNASTVNTIYSLINHDTTDMSFLRLKCADWNITIAKNIQDAYVYQGEIDLSGTVTVGGELAVLGLTLNAGAGTVAGTMYGAEIVTTGASLPAGSSAALFLSHRGGTVGHSLYIEANAGTTITDAIYINAAGTVTNTIRSTGAITLVPNNDTTNYLTLTTVASVPSIRSAAAIALMPSGDTDDYLTFSTVADIPTITATGAVGLRISSYLGINRDPSDGTDLATNGSAYIGGTVDASRLQARTDLYFVNAAYMMSPDADDNYYFAKNRDNGVALVETMRWQGAADPYVQIGRDDTGVALNAVTDMLVLQGGGGTGNEAAGFGFGISIKLGNAASELEERASWDTVLVTATNGSEDAAFKWSVMGGGAMVADLLQLDKTGLTMLNTMTEPAGTANQAGIYCIDLSVGNASIGFASEHAVAAAVGIASTHKWGIRINGATYYVMLSNV